ncbi:signal transduction protein [Candidatus Scalindua japonica]|uniref:Signal transduction protein n=1 Tax=Candidatus Scalindua japonica TaxID=1284222 RepID=A0A286TZK0_9BACT|nr:CBS domain-containing protein [Candidatus Scalindua japonica]GAX61329.1 signal transduction protein [Candidatus Scalindua japonica]
MITVKEILKDKSSNILTISPQDTVYMALEIMAEKDLGALVVVKDEKVVGLFSERDYARNIVLQGKSSKSTLVKDLMNPKPCFVRPENTLNDCMALITEKRTRHLPVLEGEKLIGIVSIGDVVKQYIVDKEFTIQQLENYIAGGL